MTQKISRRNFIKNSALVSAAGMGTFIVGNMMAENKKKQPNPKEKIDISVVKGQNYFDNTIQAVEQLGGIEAFVPTNSKVAILANPQRNNPGVYTGSEVLRAAIRLCKRAGAKEIACISWLPIEKCWEPTGLKKVVDDEGIKLTVADLKNEELFKPVPIPKGINLKEARIMNEFFNYDVFINVPICKDHAGNKFTGTLKNLMGLNSPMSNRSFHKPNWTTDAADIRHLDQCIADLNTIIKPSLCIVDATEFITSNGPFGPGNLVKPQKVVAGTDRVALDSYCCTLWGLDAKDIFTIVAAYEHGLGEMDIKKLKIKES
ncbi:MAG: DUF362 domain-containing protein [Acidobacteria bacterium]|jgi:uncharacterized protein (DUF362 family)|nr:DUF362 domain-containing protein [Acidobacteriota bacterium]